MRAECDVDLFDVQGGGVRELVEEAGGFFGAGADDPGVFRPHARLVGLLEVVVEGEEEGVGSGGVVDDGGVVVVVVGIVLRGEEETGGEGDVAEVVEDSVADFGGKAGEEVRV